MLYLANCFYLDGYAQCKLGGMAHKCVKNAAWKESVTGHRSRIGSNVKVYD